MWLFFYRRNLWYLPAEKPEGLKTALSIDIFTKQLTHGGKRMKFEFSLKGTFITILCRLSMTLKDVYPAPNRRRFAERKW